MALLYVVIGMDSVATSKEQRSNFYSSKDESIAKAVADAKAEAVEFFKTQL